jgi:hypothetical protein
MTVPPDARGRLLADIVEKVGVRDELQFGRPLARRDRRFL